MGWQSLWLVHMAGDRKYAPRESLKRWRALGLKRMFLHAHVLRLESPKGQVYEFNAPLPAGLREVLTALE